MISIFNGKSRGIGQGERQEVYVQVSVTLRAHLHLFKGAKLSIFLAIALHCDKEGWSSPSVKTLRAETGYNTHTIADALTDLCSLAINDQRVLLAVQERKNGGAFTQNRYLIFPSSEEIAKYADSSALRKPRRNSQEPEATTIPSVENLHTDSGSPSVENLHTAKIEAQGSETLQNGDSPSVEKAHALFPYGSITIKKNHVGGGGGDARTLAFLIDEGISAAEEFAHFSYEPMRADYDARRADHQTKAQIVRAWRQKQPVQGDTYADRQRPVQSDNAPDLPGRPPVARQGKHGPTGGSDLRDPGWREREIAKFEALARENGEL